VTRELADAKDQLDGAQMLLDKARAFAKDFLSRMPLAAEAAGARVQRITPGLTSR
jgi:hypothetical protein